MNPPPFNVSYQTWVNSCLTSCCNLYVKLVKFFVCSSPQIIFFIFSLKYYFYICAYFCSLQSCRNSSGFLLPLWLMCPNRTSRPTSGLLDCRPENALHPPCLSRYLFPTSSQAHQDLRTCLVYFLSIHWQDSPLARAGKFLHVHRIQGLPCWGRE